jgi:hypothetical protein
MFPKPCLDCGVIVKNGSRCPTHQSAYQKRIDELRAHKRTHYSGNYKARAKKVRDYATICWLCKQGEKPNDPWQADHVIEGNPLSPLLPAHRSCNIKKSNEKRNKTI